MSETRSNLQLGKIMLKNYKTYKGDVACELSRDLQKTITIIHGEMGHGKTTLLDAIYWCLYGENRSENTDSDEGILNTEVLGGLDVNDSDDTAVELYLYEEDELRYKIKRVMKFTKKFDSAELVQNSSIGGRLPKGVALEEEVILSYQPRGSDWILYDNDHVERIRGVIENIFPKSLSKYFLFDAELLDNFFDISDEKNAKVKDGIEKISGLPILDTAISHLTKTSNGIKNAIKGVNVEPLKDQVLLCDRKIDSATGKIKSAEDEIKGFDNEINTIESFLRTHNEDTIKDTQKRIDVLKQEIKDNKKRLNEHNQKMNAWVLNSSVIIHLSDSIKKSLDKCSVWESEGKIPIAVSGLALKNILKGSPPRCICGASLDAGSAEREHIEELLKKNLIESPIIQNITIGRGHWDNMWNEARDMKDTLQQYQTIRDGFATYDRNKYEEQKDLEKKFANTNMEEIQKKFQRLKDLKNDQRSAIESKGRAQGDLNRATRERESKDRELTTILKKDEKYKSQTNRITLANTLEKIFKKHREELVDELRGRVAEKTTQYFLKLVSRKDDFSKVQIKENYKTLALDKDQKSKSLSAGQSCCLALSYIAAIRDIAEKNYFMLIDSPLHNISQEERVDIARNLPEFLPGTQITLLVQDQEYTGHANKGITGEEIPSVRKTLMDNSSIWREYLLNTHKDKSNTSHTTIDQVKL